MCSSDLKKKEYDEGMNDTEYYSASSALGELSGHLQDYIESQLNVAENSTGE